MIYIDHTFLHVFYLKCMGGGRLSRGDCLPNLYATLLLPIPYSDFYSQRRYLIATGDRNTRNVTIGTGAVLLGSPSAVLYSTPLL